MLWRGNHAEDAGRDRGERRQLAVVQGTASSWPRTGSGRSPDPLSRDTSPTLPGSTRSNTENNNHQGLLSPHEVDVRDGEVLLRDSEGSGHRKVDVLDKMVALECSGCTGNLGHRIRRKVGKQRF